MKHEEFKEGLLDLGFIQIGIPDHSGQYVYAMYDENRIEKIRVKEEVEGAVTVEGFGGVNAYGKRELAYAHIEDLANDVEIDVLTDEELKAASRLIREVKTLTLRPDEKLLVTLRDPDGIIDRTALNNLREHLLRWLGEKDARKIMMVVADVELTKVKIDDSSNQEESS